MAPYYVPPRPRRLGSELTCDSLHAQRLEYAVKQCRGRSRRAAKGRGGVSGFAGLAGCATEPNCSKVAAVIGLSLIHI